MLSYALQRRPSGRFHELQRVEGYEYPRKRLNMRSVVAERSFAPRNSHRIESVGSRSRVERSKTWSPRTGTSGLSRPSNRDDRRPTT